jgi:iron complex transport system ATP-binding protein
MRLDIVNASCGYNHTKVVQDISFFVQTGDAVCLLGPNGIGKTTLFKCILGFLPLMDGEILLDGQNISGLNSSHLARTVSYVPQAHATPFAFRVLDVVLMGRTAHVGLFSSPTARDYEVAEQTLDSLNISHLRDKRYTEISGGERQLVLIARALAQQPRLLIMDEPTANLDFGNQVRVLEEIQKLSQKGLGILITSHSPDHAFLIATKTALLLRDRSLLFGEAGDILTAENLRAAYDVDIRVAYVEDANGRRIQTCVPMLHHTS